jgi:tetratricopeptide (TPR) repeat protein
VAARFAAEGPDLKALAAEADVDRVVMGTLLRSGDQLRASAQLVEAPGGTLLTSHTVQSSLGDLFRLQDDIARRVAAELARPLAGPTPPPAPPAARDEEERSSAVPTSRASVPAAAGPARESVALPRDTPHDPRAYEFYLRANELARSYDGLPRARDLYQRCLELDPAFAPAWAHLGRCHRVIGKFIDDTPDNYPRAEEAFRRALEINPRLSVAHKFYAQLEADLGRAPAALVRLLGEATRHRNDPELFAGLVHVCRYCGLYDEAIAAHEEARRLDPNVPTSLAQTILMTSDIERLLAVERPPAGAGGDEGIRVIGLGLAGRRDEARRALIEMGQASIIPTFQRWIEYLMAWLDRRGADMLGRLSELSGLKIMEDPEAIFQEGWLLCDVGEHARGLEQLRRAVAKGYFAAPTLARSPQFDALRSEARFQELLAQAEAGRGRALEAFRSAGGERLVGR